MKLILNISLFLLCLSTAKAQSPGDTIVVQTFMTELETPEGSIPQPLRHTTYHRHISIIMEYVIYG